MDLLHVRSAKSTTSEKSDGTWRISYGDGSTASGIVGNDTLNIIGLVIEKQAISKCLCSTSYGLTGLSIQECKFEIDSL